MSILEAYAAQPPSVPRRAKMAGAIVKRTSQSFSMVMNVCIARSIRTPSALHWTDLRQPLFSTTDLAEAEFKKQKEAFMKRVAEEPLFLAPYRGKFIASRDGQIVESDSDLHTVLDRFFTRYGDVPVYIDHVDGKRKVFIDSPNRVR